MFDAKRRTRLVSDSFSVPSLLKTLFAPWRRVTTDSSSNISEKFRAMQDNFVSRLVGFAVRAGVLFSAGLMVLAISIIGAIQVALWPLVPPAAIILLFVGLMK